MSSEDDENYYTPKTLRSSLVAKALDFDRPALEEFNLYQDRQLKISYVRSSL